MLQNKNILIGITGGIAAYKIPQLVRLLVKNGANVKVIMSNYAREFVTPQTLSVLSKNEVVTDFFDSKSNWNNHVKLAEWADVMVIAPLTANTLAKMANGLCDNLLMATYLSAKCKVMVAPAMDLDMYKHETTLANLRKIVSFGNIVIPAESGELASGLVGEGRMAEPENIYKVISNYFDNNLPLKGKLVLVNAGPTYEAIDPVRFIGNRSSGKMGIAIADEFAALGASVTLVLGPSHFKPNNKSVKLIAVESAAEMFEQCMKVAETSNIIVCSAAVADYKPETASEKKIKKENDSLTITLEKTEDILLELGKRKKADQVLVGFALETENLLEYAKEKIVSKNLDIVIANLAKNDAGRVFGSDMNEISIVNKDNKITKFELMLKDLAAKKIVNYVVDFISTKK